MIQFNLLPNVKLEYIKSRRNKRLVLGISIIASAIAVSIAVMLYVNVNIIQKRHLSNLSKDIKQESEKLQNEKDIDKILTVQNQLNNINALHDSKPAADRLNGYITQIVPNGLSFSELKVDFTTNTIVFSGESISIKTLNQFIDTLKFTNYIYTHKDDEGKTLKDKSAAFTNIVLSSFNRDDEDDNDGKPVELEVTLNFDSSIFDIQKDIKLDVPNDKLTTRSVTERPDPIFKSDPTSKGESN